jgi:hypothetical protein
MVERAGVEDVIVTRDYRDEPADVDHANPVFIAQR